MLFRIPSLPIIRVSDTDDATGSAFSDTGTPTGETIATAGCLSGDAIGAPEKGRETPLLSDERIPDEAAGRYGCLGDNSPAGLDWTGRDTGDAGAYILGASPRGVTPGCL